MMSTTAATSRLSHSLPDLGAWTAHFRAAEIPVLEESAEAIEAMRPNEDRLDANGIGEVIGGDPLMTLKVLAHAGANRSSRVVTDPETLISALVLMGIAPFFRAFGSQLSVEAQLADLPDALGGLCAVIRRAHRGANFALGLAVHRRDHDAAVLHAAALLHDFAEMLLWCHAPTLALQIRDAQRADSTLRSHAAQMAVLNIELADLQQALMKTWRLPELLIRINDDRHAEEPSVRTVMLAVRLARHTAHGWDNPAIPDDVAEIGDLLNLSAEATLELLHSI